MAGGAPENMWGVGGGLLCPDRSEAKVWSSGGVSQCGPEWVGGAALEPRSIRPAHAMAFLEIQE